MMASPGGAQGTTPSLERSNSFLGFDAKTGGAPAAVVLEFGAAFIRCGLAGEARPRFMLHTSPKLRTALSSSFDAVPLTEEEWKDEVRNHLYQIFYWHLQVNPQERHVVVCESLLAPQLLRKSLAHLLFTYLQVLSVLFVPSKGMALIPIEKHTALVVDIGYHETRCLPIFEGGHIIPSLQTTILSGKAINNKLRELLQQRSTINNPFTNTSRPCEGLADSVIEDIKVKLCSLYPRLLSSAELEETTFQQKMKYNISNEEFTEIDVCTCIQGPEILFDATDEEGEQSIAALILESLLACPCDTRVPLAQNILLIGGTALLPGIATRLRYELNRLIGTTPKYAIFQGLADQFAFIKSAFPINYLSWLGGAVMGCVDNEQTITQSQYLEKKVPLPDWMRLSETKRNRKPRKNPFRLGAIPSASPSSSSPSSLFFMSSSPSSSSLSSLSSSSSSSSLPSLHSSNLSALRNSAVAAVIPMT